MGTVPTTHASPKASKDLAWNWHGTAEADKGDAILERGGWDLFANAHAWYDPTEDEAGNDPPHEKGAYKLPHHELVDGRLRVVWRGVAAAMQVLAGARGGVDIPRSDRKSVYRHLQGHYHEFNEDVPALEELGDP
jgi:hypothetical protein